MTRSVRFVCLPAENTYVKCYLHLPSTATSHLTVLRIIEHQIALCPESTPLLRSLLYIIFDLLCASSASKTTIILIGGLSLAYGGFFTRGPGAREGFASERRLDR